MTMGLMVGLVIVMGMVVVGGFVLIVGCGRGGWHGGWHGWRGHCGGCEPM